MIGKVYSLEKIAGKMKILKKVTPLKKSLAYFCPSAASSSYLAPKIRDVQGDKEKLRKYMKNMGRAVGFCPDDGKGKVELWRIENFELAPVPTEKHGLFFGGDSYVLKYTYSEKPSGREKYIIYFWQVTADAQLAI